ncbi:FRG domain-containing protein [Mesorhizobium sp. M1272]|uniref:FRG domain-containing protein n=1 Tax=Mesorhizobium sp. M1272 TaxID=2957074 RepID=UPI003336B060
MKRTGAPKKPLLVESVTAYLQRVFELPEMTGGARCYRGESDAKWQLKPSIMRGVRSDAENRIFSELMLEAPTEFSNDKSMFDMLVRAQHYGSISSLTISSQVRKEESMMRLRIVSAAPFTALASSLPRSSMSSQRKGGRDGSTSKRTLQ